MRRLFYTLSALACLAFVVPTAPAQEAKPEKPLVEVVFCLDTTGSMGGLINAAKAKIWSMCNQIAAGMPTPNLRVGLVAYRDRSDAYVTKVFDLTDDLDAIHAHLMGFQAQGGGDFPEDVNAALHDAVTKIKWTDAKKTLKMIFLVGDAPPHMDYKDQMQYPEICKLAVTKDIIINTIQCGQNDGTKKFWTEIGRLSEGSYVQIDQKGGPVVTVATPFDVDLAKINGELAKSTVVFGDAKGQAAAAKKAKEVADLPAAAAADRAGFSSTAAAPGGGATSDDLILKLRNGAVKLEELKKEQLPEELKNLSLPDQKAYLEKVETRRAELTTQARDLNEKRQAFIQKKLKDDAKTADRDSSFDGQVFQILQRQAGRAGVKYEAPAEKK